MESTESALEQLADHDIRVETDGDTIVVKVANAQGKFPNREEALKIDYTDGLSMEFSDWRFNLRCSNTEPLLRLNVEAKGNRDLMIKKTEELLKEIDKFVEDIK